MKDSFLKKPQQPPKWQAVYDAAGSLRTFRAANARHMQDDGYRQLLELLSKKYSAYDIKDAQWKESFQMLSVAGSYEHWVGHDETISKSLEMRFEKLSHWQEPEEWSTESDWPCRGAHQYLDEYKETGDHWNYTFTGRDAWLLKEPFGLPGVWSFGYEVKGSKG